MRRGYWRTLLRRLRHKIEAGENTLVHQHDVLVISTVCAEEDVTPDDGSEVRLADDAQGNEIVLDVRAAHVMLLDRSTGLRVQVGVDLAAFVDALGSPSPG